VSRSARRAEIDAVLTDLRELLTTDNAHQYTIEENIAFFEALRTRVRFLSWLVGRRKRLDKTRMLEVTDFDFSHWQERLYLDLSAVARKSFPGLVKPLVAELSRLVRELSESQECVRLASIGCGPMEVERQLMEAARKAGIEERLLIIGVDSSSAAYRCAENNLASSGVRLTALDENANLEAVSPGVYFVESDAARFADTYGPRLFDVLYHARFVHHIPTDDLAALEGELQKRTRIYLEYDDYQSVPSLLGPLFTAWRHPVLLNGAIISWTRDRLRSELAAAYGDTARFFNPPGTYLRLIDQRKPA
jgi:hypothetical protein